MRRQGPLVVGASRGNHAHRRCRPPADPSQPHLRSSGSAAGRDHPQPPAMSIPQISIVTVVLNAAPTLERAIQSVVNQKPGSFEYVIIDGGSTDGSLDILGRYAARIDYWHSEPDQGLYDAMNKGV